MDEPIRISLVEHFETLEEPRIERSKLHNLIDIIVIAVCGAICGADSWVEIAEFGKAKEEWLGKVLELPNGIPAHDSFGRGFRRLDPEQFQLRFLEWVPAVFRVTEGPVVAVDGQQLRGSHDQGPGKSAIHRVSAWASHHRLVLGQLKVEEKSNQIKAIPALLELLDLKAGIVTTDAMGCQKAIAQSVLSTGGDYLFALKENHPQLYEEGHDLFTLAHQEQFRHVRPDFFETTSKGHGRIETRRGWSISDPTSLNVLRDRDQWPGLQTLGMLISERSVAGHTSTDTHDFISSLPSDARRLLDAPAPIGPSKTGSIGSWTFPSARTFPAFAWTMPPTPSLSSATSPLTSSNRSAPPKLVSRPSASRPPSPRTIS